MADNASSNKTNPAAPTLLVQRQKKMWQQEWSRSWNAAKAKKYPRVALCNL